MQTLQLKQGSQPHQIIESTFDQLVKIILSKVILQANQGKIFLSTTIDEKN